MPNFWLAILLINLFSVHLGWLPTSGRTMGMQSLALPAASIALYLIGTQVRLVRGTFLDVAARTICGPHTQRGYDHRHPRARPVQTLVPVVTIVGIKLGHVLGQAVVIVTGWMICARVVRAAVITLEAQTFVQAARALGGGRPSRGAQPASQRQHGHPRPAPHGVGAHHHHRVVSVVPGTRSAAADPELGPDARRGGLYFTLDNWIAVFPGLAITLTVLGGSFLGYGPRDRVDPRLKHLL
jgi:hypothetical protein